MTGERTSDRSGQKNATWRTQLSVVATSLVLAMFAGLVFWGIWLSRFNRDESQWIYTARYLTLLTHAQFTSPEWDSYWTHTQPPLARYLMGTSLKLGGFDLLHLNGPWDFSREDSQNRQEGNWPTDNMLTAARLPIALCAVGALLLLFVVGRLIGGTAAGLFAAGWFSLNPRLRELSTRSESEGLLLLLVLLALLLTIQLIRRLDNEEARLQRRSIVLSGLAGVAGGLAASTKLTGAVCLLCFWATLVLYWLFSVRGRGSSYLKRLAGHLALYAVTSGLACALVFIALNPYTYSNPVGRALSLFQFRQEEMATQMTQYPTAALDGTVERVAAALERPLFAYSLVATNLSTLDTRNGQSIGEKIPLDAVLVGLGLVASGAALVRALGSRKPGAPHAMAEPLRAVRAGWITIAWSVIVFLAIAVNMGLDWDRYVILISLFCCIWAGVGAGWLWRAATERFLPRRKTAGESEKLSEKVNEQDDEA